MAEIIAALPANTPIEIWFQDQMRVGQKNALVRQWAARGSRPRQVRDLRTAICSAPSAPNVARGRRWSRRYRGHGSAPRRDRPRRGAHAILLADQAGWHTTNRLATPANISLVPLPAKSPELNPVENVWQYLRQTWLSNRVFPDYEAILDACCRAWNNLMDRPWKIMSIGLREWALTGQH